MKANLIRTVLSAVAALTISSTISTQAQAAIICEEVLDCYQAYVINEDGFLTHTTVCDVDYECYDDGNGPNKSGKPKCVTDKITGQKVCVMP